MKMDEWANRQRVACACLTGEGLPGLYGLTWIYGFLSQQDLLCVAQACKDAHGLAVLTEWDEFKRLNYEKIYESMMKPAFVFDGRNILDHAHLRKIGFIVYALGKPLDPFLQRNYS